MKTKRSVDDNASARSYGEESSECSELSYSMNKLAADHNSDGRLSIERVWRNESVRVRVGSGNDSMLVNPVA